MAPILLSEPLYCKSILPCLSARSPFLDTLVIGDAHAANRPPAVKLKGCNALIFTIKFRGLFCQQDCLICRTCYRAG